MEDKMSVKTGFDIKIKIPALDNAIEIAKDFVDKLIMPAVEETGLLIKDFVTSFRLGNQVKILTKSKRTCEQYKLHPKTISMKLLVPLLDGAGLEEDEFLQDKWAYLLANMVDSKQNVTNHVFPYLLSQISKEEFSFLDSALLTRDWHIHRLTKEMIELRKEIDPKIKSLKKLLKETEKRLKLEHPEQFKDNKVKVMHHELSQIKYEISQLERDPRISSLYSKMENVTRISVLDLQDYELANVIRLGILNVLHTPYSYGNEVKVPEEGNTYMTFDVQIESSTEYQFTELGEKFIYACTEKNL